MNNTIQCPVCNHKKFSSVPFGYTFKKKWLGGKKCLSCGIIFLHPQPTAEELIELYSRDYFEGGDYRCGHAENGFMDEGEKIVSQALVDEIVRLKPNGKLLDIGCAGGQFLDAMKKKEYETYGVELSEDAAQLAREKFQLNVITGDLHSAHYEEQFFDIVFMGDVLEHVPNPKEVLQEIHRITHPNALLVVLCPTQTNTLFSRFGFMVYSLLHRNATVNLPPYHLLEFRPNSMQTLFRQNGFNVIKYDSTMIKPSDIAQRGSAIQNIAKKIFQYPNYFISKTFNMWGDRITMFGRRNSK